MILHFKLFVHRKTKIKCTEVLDFIELQHIKLEPKPSEVLMEQKKLTRKVKHGFLIA